MLKITSEERKMLLDYMARRPYAEVYQLISMLLLGSAGTWRLGSVAGSYRVKRFLEKVNLRRYQGGLLFSRRGSLGLGASCPFWNGAQGLSAAH